MTLAKLQMFKKLKDTGLCKATALMAIDPGLEFGCEFQTKSETIKSKSKSNKQNFEIHFEISNLFQTAPEI